MIRFVLLLLLVFPAFSWAEVGLPALKVVTNADGSQDYSVSLQILFIMTALTLLPAALMMMTAFTRIIVVLAILRQAIGLQQTPSNQIMIGMALFFNLIYYDADVG